MADKPRRIGVVGFGKLGAFLVEQILTDPDLELAFVWNRSSDALTGKVDEKYILHYLKDVALRSPDLIIEVAHPCITKNYGKLFLEVADYLIGSPTILADQEVERELRASCVKHAIYLPAGALWGGEDIKRMNDLGTLQALKITMTKHPSCFKLNGYLKEKNASITDEVITLYEGDVRSLCPLAPNNINTMAVASMLASSLGFDKVIGKLVSDPQLHEWHIVEVDAWGPGDMDSGKAFHVNTKRYNPAAIGAVTGTVTLTSFLSSLKNAVGKGPGVHLC